MRYRQLLFLAVVAAGVAALLTLAATRAVSNPEGPLAGPTQHAPPGCVAVAHGYLSSIKERDWNRAALLWRESDNWVIRQWVTDWLKHVERVLGALQDARFVSVGGRAASGFSQCRVEFEATYERGTATMRYDLAKSDDDGDFRITNQQYTPLGSTPALATLTPP